MDNNREFPGIIMDFANKIQGEKVAAPVHDVMEASVLILATITRYAFDGTDHIPHPNHSTIEKSTVGACFMAACSAPIAYTLFEQDSPIDVKELMAKAGADLFEDYSEADRHIIVDGGILLFQEIIQAARSNEKLEEWMTSVHSVTNKYINSLGDTEYVELFAPLYLVLLMAARQFTMKDATDRES
jgi:hypothetical protein